AGRHCRQGSAEPARPAKRGPPAPACGCRRPVRGATAWRPDNWGSKSAGGRPLSHPHPELGSPPPLPAHGLRIVALGGLGEIGRNMTVFEDGGRLLILDCRVSVPSEEAPAA